MSRLTIGPVRLSYAYLFEPRPAQAPGQKQKYGASLLIPKTATQTLQKIQEALQVTRQEYIKTNPKAQWATSTQCRTTLYDGDGTRPGGEEFGEEAKGHWVLSTSTHKTPLVVDQFKQPVLNQADVYSGCYAMAVINFYCYDTAGNKGVACSLDGIMKYSDGPALSGYQVTDKDWDNVASNDLAQLNALLE